MELWESCTLAFPCYPMRQTANETVMNFDRLDFLTVNLADIAHIDFGNQFPYDACRQFLQVIVLADQRNPLFSVLCFFPLFAAFFLKQRKLCFQFYLQQRKIISKA